MVRTGNHTPVVVLVYPHQLWAGNPAVTATPAAPVWLVEDPLFFTQFDVLPMKPAYHRLTMEAYRRELVATGRTVRIITVGELESSRDVFRLLPPETVRVEVTEVDDDWLEQALHGGAAAAGIAVATHDSPGFFLRRHEIDRYAAGRNRLFMADFYRSERLRRGILVTDDGRPAGGAWSFDTANRKRIPRNLAPPPPATNVHGAIARSVAADTGIALPPYPVTRDDARRWLDEFVEHRLARFGDYEDAIDSRDSRWFHSLLTPMLNVGLLTPEEVVDAALNAPEVPINSREGFVRQILGWREFMRMAYHSHGRRMRTRNALGHSQPMPEAFYRGTSGVPPFDRVVRTTRELGWAHHIERLMVAGNLMLLCRIHPDAVYRWFMELYVDAYDWVMVPNVYGMSQYADGGTMTTKPYASGSNYIRRMSDAATGEWQEIWDGLYWRFVADNRQLFAGNPRLAVMPRQLDRLDPERRRRIDAAADRFLETLW